MKDLLNILIQLLDKDPQKSTWYYQNQTIALVEHNIFVNLFGDEYFVVDDVVYSMMKDDFSCEAEVVKQQLDYMCLSTLEERFVFKEIVKEMIKTIEEISDHLENEYLLLQGILQTISDETDSIGKIVHIISDFVYVPKFLLFVIAKQNQQVFTQEQKEKLIYMKPKFAKYLFNYYLESVYQQRQSEVAVHDDHSIEKVGRRTVYGKIR